MSRGLRITLLIVGIAVAIVVLFTTVFPWVERTLEQDPTVAGDPAVHLATGDVTPDRHPRIPGRG